jgi:hypothetical protein
MCVSNFAGVKNDELLLEHALSRGPALSAVSRDVNLFHFPLHGWQKKAKQNAQ